MNYHNSKYSFMWFLTAFIIIGWMSVVKYLTLHSAVMDLGIFLFNIYKVSEMQTYGHVLYGHTHLFLLPLGWFLSLFKAEYHPFVLLLIQSMVICAPIYFLHKRFGSIIALSYFLFFPVWFNALFDFHFDHLAILFLVFFFLAIQSGNFGRAFISAIALAFVKEPFALQTIMCGFYVIFTIWKSDQGRTLFNWQDNYKQLLYGVILILFGSIFFYTSTSLILPSFFENQGSINPVFSAYAWLGSSVQEIILYLFSSPIDVILAIFSNADKVIFIVALLGSFGFIPILKPGPLLIAMPIFAIALLSTSNNYYGLGHHYTAGLVAPLIFAFSAGIPVAQGIWKKIGFPAQSFIPILLIGLFASHIALSPSPISRLFWNDKIWSYSYKAYITTERDKMIKMAINEFVPLDSEKIVSMQNTINFAPLVQRPDILIFPAGIDEVLIPSFGKNIWPPKNEMKSVFADFVIIDKKRPLYLIDRGCKWLYGDCQDKEVKKDFLIWVTKASSEMNVVFENDGFIIFQR
jgi:uncharacterized membrane protein